METNVENPDNTNIQGRHGSTDFNKEKPTETECDNKHIETKELLKDYETPLKHQIARFRYVYSGELFGKALNNQPLGDVDKLIDERYRMFDMKHGNVLDPSPRRLNSKSINIEEFRPATVELEHEQSNSTKDAALTSVKRSEEIIGGNVSQNARRRSLVKILTSEQSIDSDTSDWTHDSNSPGTSNNSADSISEALEFTNNEDVSDRETVSKSEHALNDHQYDIQEYSGFIATKGTSGPSTQNRTSDKLLKLNEEEDYSVKQFMLHKDGEAMKLNQPTLNFERLLFTSDKSSEESQGSDETNTRLNREHNGGEVIQPNKPTLNFERLIFTSDKSSEESQGSDEINTRLNREHNGGEVIQPNKPTLNFERLIFTSDRSSEESQGSDDINTIYQDVTHFNKTQLIMVEKEYLKDWGEIRNTNCKSLHLSAPEVGQASIVLQSDIPEHIGYIKSRDIIASHNLNTSDMLSKSYDTEDELVKEYMLQNSGKDMKPNKPSLNFDRLIFTSDKSSEESQGSDDIKNRPNREHNGGEAMKPNKPTLNFERLIFTCDKSSEESHGSEDINNRLYRDVADLDNRQLTMVEKKDIKDHSEARNTSESLHLTAPEVGQASNVLQSDIPEHRGSIKIRDISGFNIPYTSNVLSRSNDKEDELVKEYMLEKDDEEMKPEKPTFVTSDKSSEESHGSEKPNTVVNRDVTDFDYRQLRVDEKEDINARSETRQYSRHLNGTEVSQIIEPQNISTAHHITAGGLKTQDRSEPSVSANNTPSIIIQDVRPDSSAIDESNNVDIANDRHQETTLHPNWSSTSERFWERVSKRVSDAGISSMIGTSKSNSDNSLLSGMRSSYKNKSDEPSDSGYSGITQASTESRPTSQKHGPGGIAGAIIYGPNVSTAFSKGVKESSLSEQTVTFDTLSETTDHIIQSPSETSNDGPSNSSKLTTDVTPDFGEFKIDIDSRSVDDIKPDSTILHQEWSFISDRYSDRANLTVSSSPESPKAPDKTSKNIKSGLTTKTKPGEIKPFSKNIANATLHSDHSTTYHSKMESDKINLQTKGLVNDYSRDTENAQKLEKSKTQSHKDRNMKKTERSFTFYALTPPSRDSTGITHKKYAPGTAETFEFKSGKRSGARESNNETLPQTQWSFTHRAYNGKESQEEKESNIHKTSQVSTDRSLGAQKGRSAYKSRDQPTDRSFTYQNFKDSDEVIRDNHSDVYKSYVEQAERSLAFETFRNSDKVSTDNQSAVNKSYDEPAERSFAFETFRNSDKVSTDNQSAVNKSYDVTPDISFTYKTFRDSDKTNSDNQSAAYKTHDEPAERSFTFQTFRDSDKVISDIQGAAYKSHDEPAERPFTPQTFRDSDKVINDNQRAVIKYHDQPAERSYTYQTFRDSDKVITDNQSAFYKSHDQPAERSFTYQTLRDSDKVGTDNQSVVDTSYDEPAERSFTYQTFRDSDKAIRENQSVAYKSHDQPTEKSFTFQTFKDSDKVITNNQSFAEKPLTAKRSFTYHTFDGRGKGTETATKRTLDTLENIHAQESRKSTPADFEKSFTFHTFIRSSDSDIKSKDHEETSLRSERSFTFRAFVDSDVATEFPRSIKLDSRMGSDKDQVQKKTQPKNEKSFTFHTFSDSKKSTNENTSHRETPLETERSFTFHSFSKESSSKADQHRIQNTPVTTDEILDNDKDVKYKTAPLKSEKSFTFHTFPDRSSSRYIKQVRIPTDGGSQNDADDFTYTAEQDGINGKPYRRGMNFASERYSTFYGLPDKTKASGRTSRDKFKPRTPTWSDMESKNVQNSDILPEMAQTNEDSKIGGDDTEIQDLSFSNKADDMSGYRKYEEKDQSGRKLEAENRDEMEMSDIRTKYGELDHERSFTFYSFTGKHGDDIEITSHDKTSGPPTTEVQSSANANSEKRRVVELSDVQSETRDANQTKQNLSDKQFGNVHKKQQDIHMSNKEDEYDIYQENIDLDQSSVTPKHGGGTKDIDSDQSVTIDGLPNNTEAFSNSTSMTNATGFIARPENKRRQETDISENKTENGDENTKYQEMSVPDRKTDIRDRFKNQDQDMSVKNDVELEMTKVHGTDGDLGYNDLDRLRTNARYTSRLDIDISDIHSEATDENKEYLNKDQTDQKSKATDEDTDENMYKFDRRSENKHDRKETQSSVGESGSKRATMAELIGRSQYSDITDIQTEVDSFAHMYASEGKALDKNSSTINRNTDEFGRMSGVKDRNKGPNELDPNRSFTIYHMQDRPTVYKRGTDEKTEVGTKAVRKTIAESEVSERYIQYLDINQINNTDTKTQDIENEESEASTRYQTRFDMNKVTRMIDDMYKDKDDIKSEATRYNTDLNNDMLDYVSKTSDQRFHEKERSGYNKSVNNDMLDAAFKFPDKKFQYLDTDLITNTDTKTQDNEDEESEASTRYQTRFDMNKVTRMVDDLYKDKDDIKSGVRGYNTDLNNDILDKAPKTSDKRFHEKERKPKASVYNTSVNTNMPDEASKTPDKKFRDKNNRKLEGWGYETNSDATTPHIEPTAPDTQSKDKETKTLQEIMGYRETAASEDYMEYLDKGEKISKENITDRETVASESLMKYLDKAAKFYEDTANRETGISEGYIEYIDDGEKKSNEDIADTETSEGYLEYLDIGEKMSKEAIADAETLASESLMRYLDKAAKFYDEGYKKCLDEGPKKSHDNFANVDTETSESYMKHVDAQAKKSHESITYIDIAASGGCRKYFDKHAKKYREDIADHEIEACESNRQYLDKRAKKSEKDVTHTKAVASEGYMEILDQKAKESLEDISNRVTQASEGYMEYLDKKPKKSQEGITDTGTLITEGLMEYFDNGVKRSKQDNTEKETAFSKGYRKYFYEGAKKSGEDISKKATAASEGYTKYFDEGAKKSEEEISENAIAGREGYKKYFDEGAKKSEKEDSEKATAGTEVYKKYFHEGAKKSKEEISENVTAASEAYKKYFDKGAKKFIEGITVTETVASEGYRKYLDKGAKKSREDTTVTGTATSKGYMECFDKETKKSKEDVAETNISANEGYRKYFDEGAMMSQEEITGTENAAREGKGKYFNKGAKKSQENITETEFLSNDGYGKYFDKRSMMFKEASAGYRKYIDEIGTTSNAETASKETAASEGYMKYLDKAKRKSPPNTDSTRIEESGYKKSLDMDLDRKVYETTDKQLKVKDDRMPGTGIHKKYLDINEPHTIPEASGRVPIGKEDTESKITYINHEDVVLGNNRKKEFSDKRASKGQRQYLDTSSLDIVDSNEQTKSQDENLYHRQSDGTLITKEKLTLLASDEANNQEDTQIQNFDGQKEATELQAKFEEMFEKHLFETAMLYENPELGDINSVASGAQTDEASLAKNVEGIGEKKVEGSGVKEDDGSSVRKVEASGAKEDGVGGAKKVGRCAKEDEESGARKIEGTGTDKSETSGSKKGKTIGAKTEDRSGAKKVEGSGAQYGEGSVVKIGVTSDTEKNEVNDTKKGDVKECAARRKNKSNESGAKLGESSDPKCEKSTKDKGVKEKIRMPSIHSLELKETVSDDAMKLFTKTKAGASPSETLMKSLFTKVDTSIMEKFKEMTGQSRKQPPTQARYRKRHSTLKERSNQSSEQDRATPKNYEKHDGHEDTPRADKTSFSDSSEDQMSSWLTEKSEEDVETNHTLPSSDSDGQDKLDTSASDSFLQVNKTKDAQSTDNIYSRSCTEQQITTNLFTAPSDNFAMEKENVKHDSTESFVPQERKLNKTKSSSSSSSSFSSSSSSSSSSKGSNDDSVPDPADLKSFRGEEIKSIIKDIREIISNGQYKDVDLVKKTLQDIHIELCGMYEKASYRKQHRYAKYKNALDMVEHQSADIELAMFTTRESEVDQEFIDKLSKDIFKFRGMVKELALVAEKYGASQKEVALLEHLKRLPTGVKIQKLFTEKHDHPISHSASSVDIDELRLPHSKIVRDLFIKSDLHKKVNDGASVDSTEHDSKTEIRSKTKIVKSVGFTYMFICALLCIALVFLMSLIWSNTCCGSKFDDFFLITLSRFLESLKNMASIRHVGQIPF